MKIGVIIGRFQPLHSGHAEILKTALKECEQVTIVLGSANRCRSIKNPFTVAERKEMINGYMIDNMDNAKGRVNFVESPDNLYKEWTWKSEIVRRVNDVAPSGSNVKFVLYGYFKDSSSYYLSEFPEWTLREVPNFHSIDATSFRKTYFEDGIISDYYLPNAVQDFMDDFKGTEAYEDLIKDWEFFKWEKEAFKFYPFPDTLNFTCTDAIVVCQGNILLIQRKAAPGKNTWALPGGFKNNNESFVDACIRELKEETNLRIPEKVLAGSIKAQHMFDDPGRSIGIPRVTMGYYIEVQPNNNGAMPSIRPATDAFKAEWIPLAEATSMNLFSDHLDIIKWFV